MIAYTFKIGLVTKGKLCLIQGKCPGCFSCSSVASRQSQNTSHLTGTLPPSSRVSQWVFRADLSKKVSWLCVGSVSGRQPHLPFVCHRHNAAVVLLHGVHHIEVMFPVADFVSESYEAVSYRLRTRKTLTWMEVVFIDSCKGPSSIHHPRPWKPPGAAYLTVSEDENRNTSPC